VPANEIAAVTLKENDVDEAAGLLKERSELIAAMSAGMIQIKLDITFRPELYSKDQHVEHWLTRSDALLDHESNDLTWRLLWRRIALIDERLAELGIKVIRDKDVVPAPAGTQ